MRDMSSGTSPSLRLKSRVEINFNRLIVRCEAMAMDTENVTNPENWRLEKYVSALESLLNELKSVPHPPDRDQLQEYLGRVEFLKGVLNTGKLSSLPEKVIASELISPAQVITPDTSPGISSPMEIKHRHKTKYAEDLRRELLGESPIQPDNTGNEPLAGNGLNDLVRYHHSIQEKIADHMLELTRTLKDQVTIAGQVVKKDTEILEKSGNLIDKNEGRLRIEADKLSAYNKRACKCWIWVMLVVVCSVFIAMVLFMRLFKKRSY